MLVSLKKLIGLPVFTQSGSRLGKVSAVNIDTDSHTVREYLTHASIFNSRVFLIKPAQVADILEDKMVVEDAVLKNLEKEQIEKSVVQMAGDNY